MKGRCESNTSCRWIADNGDTRESSDSYPTEGVQNNSSISDQTTIDISCPDYRDYWESPNCEFNVQRGDCLETSSNYEYVKSSCPVACGFCPKPTRLKPGSIALIVLLVFFLGGPVVFAVCRKVIRSNRESQEAAAASAEEKHQTRLDEEEPTAPTKLAEQSSVVSVPIPLTTSATSDHGEGSINSYDV